MSEKNCPICAARCRDLRQEYREARAKKSKKACDRAIREAKRLLCAWAMGRSSSP